MPRQNIADLGQCLFKKSAFNHSAGVSIVRAKVSLLLIQTIENFVFSAIVKVLG
jgi:hypothetical protein